MIDYERAIVICNEQSLEFEELMLLYMLYSRQQNRYIDVTSETRKYYSGTKWRSKIESLAERGFIVVSARRGDKRFDIINLQISEDFSNLLFCNPEEIWENFLKRYPLKGISPDGGVIFDSAVLVDYEKDKDFFVKNVTKNGDVETCKEVIRFVEELFAWDGATTNENAKVGISRFIRNYDTYYRMLKPKHVEEDEEDYTRL